MYFNSLALALAIFLLNFIDSVSAGLFVVQPLAQSTCKAGQQCVVTWLDDGEKPLLSDIGVCTLGLYRGKQKLVQTLPPVDVSSSRSVSFKPNPAAGPNSGSYYLSFISTSLKLNSNGSGSELPYAAFSPFFSLEGMSGSFDHPLPEATSTHPIPSSLARGGSPSTKPLSTITIGTLSTSLPPLPSQTLLSIPPSSASRLVSSSTATSPTSTSPSTSTSGAPASTTSNSASGQHRIRIYSILLPVAAALLYIQ